MTAPHIGNTGMNDEDPESSRIWVAGYVVRDPARGPVQLAVAALARRRAPRAGRGRHLRHRHPRADPPPARARRHAGRHLLDRDRPRGAAGAGPRRRARWPAPNLSAEVCTPSRTSSRRWARSGSPSPPIDLGIKANTPRMMAERGIEVHVLPATATLDDVLAVTPDGLFFSNGPGDPAADDRQVELLQEALAGAAVLRDLLRQPALRPGARLRHLQADLRPPRHQPAGHGPHHRQGRGDRPQPRLRGGRAAGRARPTTPYGVATVSHVCLNDDVVEGLELATRRAAEGVLGAVPPGGRRRSARRGVPLRPVRDLMEARGPLATARGSRHVRADAEARGHPQRPGHRLRPDRDRPGLRVRLLGHPGLPGATARRASGSSWSTPTRPRS